MLIDGTDPHSYAAAMFAGLELEAFERLPNKKQLRQQAKVFNFGLPAGFGAAALVDHAKFAYGAEFVQTRYSPDSNMRTTLLKIITAAKLVPWPRLLQNLRATRETELLAKYPAKDVTSWLGNSPTVASKHYAMAIQESFIRATQDGASLPGITAGVETKSTPKNTPHAARLDEKWQETKKAIAERPREIWHFLAMALAGLPLITPCRSVFSKTDRRNIT